ncbi:lipase family protein [Leclercia adecarboxylata]|nr:lipase family protein [Leclercia adecarboxylata]
MQLVDENDNAVANMPWRAENEATRDKVIDPYTGVTDSKGILRIDDLLHPDLTLFVKAQPLADVMEQRPLSIERTYSYSMKMSPVTVDKKAGLICYYVVIGQLCDKAPSIPGWEGKELPSFHFPDPEFSGLTISNMYFNSRVIVKICPFRAWNILLHHTKDYSMVNAVNLGLLSDFAYEGRERILSFFNQHCQDMSKVPSMLHTPVAIDVPFRQRYVNPVFLDTTEGDNGKGGSQLFYVYNDRQLIVGWRGTEPNKFFDIDTDLTFFPTSCPDIVQHGYCHLGFLDAYKLAESKFHNEFDTIRQLSEKYEFFITGHSLGGALSLIHSATLKDSLPLVYSYGMPRTFTKNAVLLLDGVIHFRHINDSDTVSSVPIEIDVYNEMYKSWANLASIFGAPKIISNTAIKLKEKTADPFWHHGGIVVFFKAEQSMVKYLKKTIKPPSTEFGVNSPTIKIKQISYEKAKLYIVPQLNENLFCESAEKQKNFVHCLDPDSLKRYFPKNTNPDLDSLSNPINHLMANKYIPFLNNQLLELEDPSRGLERKNKRQEFEKKVDEAMLSSDEHSSDEAARNKLFLKLQTFLPHALEMSKCDIVSKNALVRFNNLSKERYEDIN